LTPGQTLPLIRQALVGLKAAHGAGIIHRDLKPDNLFILREKAGTADFVKIIDFGISKFHVLGGDMSMTRTGAVMGTPYYMSPEQARGSRDIDIRSDLYAMGVIMYEALSGAKPFDAETFNELLFKIVLSTPPPLTDVVPEIDRAFETIVYKAMARDVAHRFQTAEDLIAALDAWAQGGNPVTIPPEIGHGPPPDVAIPRPAPLPAAGMPPQQAHGATANGAVWSSSSDDVVIPVRQSKAPLIAALGAVAFVMLAGGAFAAYKIATRGSAEATATSTATPDVAAAIPAEPAPSAEPDKSAEPAEPTPPASAEPDKPAEVAAKPIPGKPVAAKPVVAKPTEKPVAAKPGEKPPVKPVKPKPGGDDFGY
jgi:serine/threonine-protein kinase